MADSFSKDWFLFYICLVSGLVVIAVFFVPVFLSVYVRRLIDFVKEEEYDFGS